MLNTRPKSKKPLLVRNLLYVLQSSDYFLLHMGSRKNVFFQSIQHYAAYHSNLDKVEFVGQPFI